MVDEIHDRIHHTGRAELHAGIDWALGRLGSTIGKSLETFHRIQWSAPWADKTQDAGCA